MKARIFWAVVVVALMGTIGWRVLAVRSKRSAPAQVAAEVTLIKSAKVQRADLHDTVAFTGTVRPKNEVEVFTKVPGRIESLLVQVGDRVKASQIVAVVEHREIAWQSKAADAAVAVAKANLDGAKLTFDRTEALFKGGSSTQSQMDQAKVALALSEAQLAQAQAAAGLAQQNLANATIVAPVAGTVVRRPVNIGSNIGPGNVVVTLQDTETLKLEASVDAPSFAKLKKGAQALVSTEALPGETFVGKVALLSPSLDAATRRAAIEIEIDNASGRLLPNMFARAEVKVGELKGVVAVPRFALYEGGGGAVVYRIEGGRAQRIRPRLGPVDGEWVVVEQGLGEGDEVAATGQASLADGAAVRVSETVQAPKVAKQD